MTEYLNKLKPETWPSPCFVTDIALLKKNAAILDAVQERTGAKIGTVPRHAGAALRLLRKLTR